MLTDISPKRINELVDKINHERFTPDRYEDLKAAIVQVMSVDYPDLHDKIALYVAAQPQEDLSDRLPATLCEMVGILEYRPDWIGAPIAQIAVEAMQEARRCSSFHATAEVLDCKPEKYDADHVISTLLHQSVYPKTFLQIITDHDGYEFAYPNDRKYGEHSIEFNFLRLKVPTAEGEKVLVSIPIYGIAPDFNSLFNDQFAGEQLKKAWESWMALAQYVGHDDLHHMYEFRDDDTLSLRIIGGIAHAIRNDSDGELSENEVFIRSLHAKRMELQNSQMPELMEKFLYNIGKFHAAMSATNPKSANAVAFALVCGALDHAIAERNYVNCETLDAIEAAMHKMNLTYRDELLSDVSSDAIRWNMIADNWKNDCSNRNVGWEVEDYEGNSDLTGLPALWHAIICSGTKTHKYAYSNNINAGEVCHIQGKGYVSAKILAEMMSAQMYKEAAASDGLVGKIYTVLSDERLDAGVREQLQKFQITWLSDAELADVRKKQRSYEAIK